MEVTGIVVGGLPLAAQLFQSTLALYSHYSESQDIGKTSNKYRTFLQIERHRYENVGAYIGLSRGNPTRHLQPATLDLILDILAHIARALLETQKLERKYSFSSSTSTSTGLSPTQTSSPTSLSSVEPWSSRVTQRLERHAVLAEEVKRSVSRLSSVRFAVRDKNKFEQFILDLRNFNDGLENVTGYQPQLRSQLIVQMLDVQEAQALSALSIATENVYPTLSEMAKRKAAYLDMRDRQKRETSGGTTHLNKTSGLKLNYGDISMQKGTHSFGRTFGSYQGMQIMIEWKVLGEELSYDQSISRIEDMSRFLSKSSITQDDVLSPSHLLGCIGYSLRPGQTERVAIIYETLDTKHITLHDMINDQAHADFNLGARFRLAISLSECIFYLHLTGWLHKGLRSSNIIIRGDSSQEESGTKALRAYLAGFSTARLDAAAEISEKIETDAHSDLYHHPRYQSANKDESRYTRQYDIYSLGMILLEIGSWQLIETSGNYKPKGYNPSRFLSKLLKGPVQSLSFTTGNAYKRAVVWCLQGQFEKNGSEPEFASLTESEMSTVFWEKVVLELGKNSVEE